MKDDKGKTSLLAVVVLVFVVLIFGAFSAVIMQKATEDIPYNNSTQSGQVRQQSDDLIGVMLQAWPILGLLAALLLGLLFLAFFRR